MRCVNFTKSIKGALRSVFPGFFGAVLVLSFLWMTLGVTAFAQSRWEELDIDASSGDNRVFDLADIYSESEELQLNSHIEKIKSLTGWDIGIVTSTLGVSQWEMQDLADDIYDYCGFGYAEQNYSGTVLVIDMNSRQFCISTFGTAIAGVNDRYMDDIYDDIEDCLRDGDNLGGAYGYVNGLADSYIHSSLPKQTDSEGFIVDSEGNRYIADGHGFDANGNIKYNSFFEKWAAGLKVTWIPTLIVLVPAVSIFLIIVSRRYKRFGQGNSTAPEAQERITLKKSNDVFVDKRIVITKIPRNSGGSGRSGGGSSTHTSSSGRTHGGGGGRGF